VNLRVADEPQGNRTAARGVGGGRGGAEVFGQLADVGQLVADELRLLLVHLAEHLESHPEGLAVLLGHLLPGLGELLDEGRDQRVRQLGPRRDRRRRQGDGLARACGREVAAEADPAGTDLGFVAVVEPRRADGPAVEERLRAPEQVDEPDPRRGPYQAAVNAPTAS
jgi:hypothetical protein